MLSGKYHKFRVYSTDPQISWNVKHNTPNLQGLFWYLYLNKTDLDQNVCNDSLFIVFFILFCISKFSKEYMYNFINNKKKYERSLAQIWLYLISTWTYFQKYLKAFNFCIGDHIDDQWDGYTYFFCNSERRLRIEMLSWQPLSIKQCGLTNL